MDCEMCGKPATCVASIEGANLQVCEKCAQHGTIVRRIAAPKKPEKKASSAAASARQEQRDEIVETVRPDVAKILRREREQRKLTQEQFAAKLQIRASTYSHYEGGAATPDIESARKIEAVIKIPLVVHIKISAPVSGQHEEGRGLMLGDFVKKKK